MTALEAAPAFVMFAQRWRFLRRLGTAIAAALLAATGCTASSSEAVVELSHRSEPLQQPPSDFVQRILIVGDSTAVGTGASGIRGSLAGLIAHNHPQLHIENRARKGATFADVPGQLSGDDRFDLILVLAGGNDVVRLRAFEAVRRDIDRVVSMASARAGHVVLMPPGNVGNARLFVPPLSWLMTSRSRALHDHVRAAALLYKVEYVNLFLEREADPFVIDAGLTAPDGLHPSDEGYLVWYRELLAQTGLAELLSQERGF